MTQVVAKYTEEDVAVLKDMYDPKADVDTRDAQILAAGERLGKSLPSIRAKLTYEGLYVPKYNTPKGKAGASKAELIQNVADKIGMDVDTAGSLEKVTKTVLNRLLKTLNS